MGFVMRFGVGLHACYKREEVQVFDESGFLENRGVERLKISWVRYSRRCITYPTRRMMLPKTRRAKMIVARLLI